MIIFDSYLGLFKKAIHC